MSVRETGGWAASFVLGMALLVVYSAPLWAFLFVGAVAVLFVGTALQPARRLRMTRQDVLEEAGGGVSWIWLRFILPLVGIGIAALQGDGMFVVFGVLIAATLVLCLVVFQILGIEFFGGTSRKR